MVGFAQPSGDSAHLSWVRAPAAVSCGDAGAVQADVARRLGRDPFAEPSRLFIEAMVTREGSEWRAELEMRDAAGESLGSRTVVSDVPSCASLVSAAGLSIALMLDHEAARNPPPSPAPPPPPPVDREPLAPAPAAEARAHGARGSVVAALTGAALLLPEPALGLRVGGDLTLAGALDLALALHFFPEQRQELSGFDVSFGLTYASLGPCYRVVDVARVQLAGCGAFSLGAMHAVTFEPEQSQKSELRWTAASLGLQAAWLLFQPVTLRAGVEAVVPLEQHEYLILRDDSAPVRVFADPEIGATAHFGLGGRF